MNVPTRKEEFERLKQIIGVLRKYEGDSLIRELRLRHFLPKGKKVKGTPKKFYQPKNIRKILEELGGSFIKLGQLLSLRPDLLPREYIKELGYLQDHAIPVKFDKIKKILEKELGSPLHIIYKSFDSKPLFSASVSQVHKATLPNGKIVAVKVQRPDIQKLFDVDIAILKFLAKHAEERLDIKIISPMEFVEEFEDYTKKELDFMREAKHIEKFHEYFAKDPKTRIPKVFWDYTTKKVITMDFVDGIPINRPEELLKAKLSPSKIATNLTNSLYTQMLMWGVFHADPHPGNVFALKNNKIALLDFGIVGRFTPTMQRHLGQIFIALFDGDIDSIAEGLLMLKILTPESDTEKFKRDLLENLSQFYDVSLEHIKLSDFILEMIKVMRNNHMKVPRDFVLLGKAILTLEGTCHVLDPKFNVVTAGKSFLKDLIKYERSPKKLLKNLVRDTTRFRNFVMNLPEQTRELLEMLRKADDYIASINNTIKMLVVVIDKITNRLIIAMLAVAFIGGGALTINFTTYLIYDIPAISFIMFSIAGLLSFALIFSILGGRRFTRKLFEINIADILNTKLNMLTNKLNIFRRR